MGPTFLESNVKWLKSVMICLPEGTGCLLSVSFRRGLAQTIRIFTSFFVCGFMVASMDKQTAVVTDFGLFTALRSRELYSHTQI